LPQPSGEGNQFLENKKLTVIATIRLLNTRVLNTVTPVINQLTVAEKAVILPLSLTVGFFD